VSLASGIIGSFLDRRFLTFLLVGGFAAFVNWLSRFYLNDFMSFSAAIVLAYLIGMVTAFVLSRLIVFEKSGRSAHSDFLRFTIVNVVAVIQVWLISVALAGWLMPWAGFTWHAEEIAHAVGVAAPIVTSYLGHRHFTFGKSQTNIKD
jgi:putative flippase GtrA